MTRRDNGIKGEEKAINYLKETGYEIIEANTKNAAHDILASKDGITYAINVKSAQTHKGMFGIQVSNISRLRRISKEKKSIMAYLLVHEDNFAMLIPNEKEFNWKKESLWGNKRNKVVRPIKDGILGTTKLTTDNKMTLIEQVAEKMKAGKGDLIAFYEDDGKIIIEKA